MQSPFPQRSLPADVTAERATLGSVLLERDAIFAIMPWLTADLFYLEKHAWIFEAVLACANQRVPPDLSTVSDELRRRDRLDLVGGIAFLGELSAEVPSAVHVEYYARIVQRTAILRRLIEAGGNISALGYDEREDVETTLDKAEKALFAVSQLGTSYEFVPMAAVATDAYEQIAASDEQGLGLPTGYAMLDSFGLMGRSDLIVLAGRPSMGKTSLALGVAYNVASEGKGVGVFSQEMDRQQLLLRLVAVHLNMDSERVIRRLRGGDPDVLRAWGEVSMLPIFVDDSPGLSIFEIRSKARRLAARESISLFILDYIQLARDDSVRDNEVREITNISRGLKSLAGELRVPVVALSQLTRAVEGRQSKVPLLSDLRGSGSIEQDADKVWMLYRDEYYNRESDQRGIAEVHIAKHRNGPIGIAVLRFERASTRFSDLERYR